MYLFANKRQFKTAPSIVQTVSQRILENQWYAVFVAKAIIWLRDVVTVAVVSNPSPIQLIRANWFSIDGCPNAIYRFVHADPRLWSMIGVSNVILPLPQHITEKLEKLFVIEWLELIEESAIRLKCPRVCKRLTVSSALELMTAKVAPSLSQIFLASCQVLASV